MLPNPADNQGIWFPQILSRHAKEACLEVWMDLIGAAPAERRFARVDPSWNLDSGRTPAGTYTLWN